MNMNKKLIYAVVCALGLQAAVPAYASTWTWSHFTNWFHTAESKKAVGVVAGLVAAVAVFFGVYVWTKKRPAPRAQAPAPRDEQQAPAQAEQDVQVNAAQQARARLDEAIAQARQEADANEAAAKAALEEKKKAEREQAHAQAAQDAPINAAGQQAQAAAVESIEDSELINHADAPEQGENGDGELKRIAHNGAVYAATAAQSAIDQAPAIAVGTAAAVHDAVVSGTPVAAKKIGKAAENTTELMLKYLKDSPKIGAIRKRYTKHVDGTYNSWMKKFNAAKLAKDYDTAQANLDSMRQLLGDQIDRLHDDMIKLKDEHYEQEQHGSGAGVPVTTIRGDECSLLTTWCNNVQRINNEFVVIDQEMKKVIARSAVALPEAVGAGQLVAPAMVAMPQTRQVESKQRSWAQVAAGRAKPAESKRAVAIPSEEEVRHQRLAATLDQ